jgi:hypothetical protein
MNQLLLKGSVNLSAQLMNEHVNHIGGVLRPQLPGPIRDLVASENLSRVSEKQFQNRVLAAGQVNRPAAPLYAMSDGIEGQVGHSQLLTSKRRLAPTKRTETSQELLKHERLTQIIIGPYIQSLDAIFNFSPCGQHQDWRPHSIRTPPATNLHAVASRQYHVQDYHVVGLSCQQKRAVQSRSAVGNNVDRVKLLAQPMSHLFAQSGIVLNQEYSHQLKSCRQRPTMELFTYAFGATLRSGPEVVPLEMRILESA